MLTQYKERSDWKAYLEILLSLITVSVFSIFALRPTILTIAQLIKQIGDKKATIAQMDEKIQALSKAQTLYYSESGNIQILTGVSVPQKASLDIFARQMEALSSKYQLGLTRLSLGEATLIGPQPPAKKTDNSSSLPPIVGSSELPYSVTLEGGIDQYKPMVSLISEFEFLRTISKIDNLSLGVKVNQKTGDRTLIILLEGRLPYLLNQAEQ